PGCSRPGTGASGHQGQTGRGEPTRRPTRGSDSVMIEATTRDIRSGDLRLQPRERRRERWIAAVLMAAAVFTIAVTVAVIVVLARETFGFFLHPDVTVWEFLTSRQWTP